MSNNIPITNLFENPYTLLVTLLIIALALVILFKLWSTSNERGKNKENGDIIGRSKGLSTKANQKHK